MKQLNYDDYKEKPIYVVHEDILSKVLKLVYQIIKEKNIDMDKYSYIDSEYERIYHMFYYDVNLCSDIKYLIKELGIEYDTSNTSNDDIDSWIFSYNSLIDEFNDYLDVKKEVEIKGFENVYDKLLDDLKNLFKEMLDYKNKPYNDDDKLSILLKKVEQYYNYYILTISDLQSALVGYAEGENIDEQPKRLNNIEIIIKVRANYNYLKKNYRENAFIYRDYELKEGESFSDLYIKYLDRSYDLYREMLDFLKIEYDNKKPPIFIIDKVKKYYPFYIDYIDDNNKPYFNPYAALLTRMDEYYEIMSKNYKKDFINEINRYQRFIKNNKDLSIDEIANKLNMTIEEIEKINEIVNEDISFKDDNYIPNITEEIKEKMKDNLIVFNDRDKEILKYRFGLYSGIEHSILETAEHFNLTTTRIKQIEAKAIRKIRKI